MQSNITFTVSTRGNPLLVIDSHQYYQKRETLNYTTWRCVNCNTLKCKSTVHTRGTEIIKKPSDHNHGTHAGESEARQVIQKIKENSLQKTATVAVAETVLQHTSEIATQLALPRKQYLVRTANRHRQLHSDLPKEPIPSNRHFEIPEAHRDFVLYDTGIYDPERILVFGDQDMLKLLSIYPNWLADGTFKVVPEIFYQLYTIHVELKAFSPPCFYAFLPNKTEKTYQRLLHIWMKPSP